MISASVVAEHVGASRKGMLVATMAALGFHVGRVKRDLRFVDLIELELIGVPVILGSVDVWVLQSEDSRRVTALTVVLSEPDEDPKS
jgi:hypothetical protein